MAKALGSARNVADADELVQEAFLRAWRELGRLRDEARFGPWLHRVLENLAVDRARRRWREVPLPEPAAREAEADAPDPESALLARELVTRVADALESIPEGRQKEVFRMRYSEGMTLGDIADRLGVHSGTVKVHLFRTAKRLRRLLADPEAAR
jgi:RNA polymerase sigma-70 factor (ECF subfamily)